MRGRGLTLVVYLLAAAASVLPLMVVAELLRDGAPLLSPAFATAASRALEAGGGVGPEVWNTLYVVGGALLLSVPVGLGVGVLRVE